ncbi:ABC transporter ATP-binding protein [Paenibacillus gansuensis]|uniref:ABC transporter ATP-binding protein n=1 Tax=Paenibacillus gansuensis TaxID=306542 RepID=A0ABW5P7P9_9BACL
MLSVNGVVKSYRTGGVFSRERHTVLHSISFEWKPGERLGIIGESGSGKSTLGRLLIGIEKPDRGSVLFHGQNIGDPQVRRGRISAVFQDYTSSINPFYTVEQALLEPLKQQNTGRRESLEKIDLLLQQVGLEPSYRSKYPHELSGGQAQRVCIARAVVTEPECIVLDEAVSSLDGSVQFQVLELLQKIGDLYGVGYIFITHDIQAAAYVCDRVMFIRNGHIVETAETDQLKNVQSPYARALLQAVTP